MRTWSASLFIFHPQLLQDLLVAGLAGGNAVQIAAGSLADGHPLGGKGTANVAQIALVLLGSGECLFCPHAVSPYDIQAPFEWR